MYDTAWMIRGMECERRLRSVNQVESGQSVCIATCYAIIVTININYQIRKLIFISTPIKTSKQKHKRPRLKNITFTFDFRINIEQFYLKKRWVHLYEWY